MFHVEQKLYSTNESLGIIIKTKKAKPQTVKPNE